MSDVVAIIQIIFLILQLMKLLGWLPAKPTPERTAIEPPEPEPHIPDVATQLREAIGCSFFGKLLGVSKFDIANVPDEKLVQMWEVV